MKNIKKSTNLISILASLLILQGCYTQMESSKKVRVNRRPIQNTKTITYTVPVENDSLVYYQDEDGDIYFEDEFGNINYVEIDSVFAGAYQNSFAINTPDTQLQEVHHYYYDDVDYDPYFDDLG